MPESVLRPMTDIIPAIGALAKKIPFEEWAEIGMKLRVLQGEIRWAIGDWLAYGKKHYGEDIYQVVDIWEEYSANSLSAMRLTSVAFPRFRRRKSVSWSNHAELRNVPESKQEEWLDKMENGASREDAREAFRMGPPRPHCKSCTCFKP